MYQRKLRPMEARLKSKPSQDFDLANWQLDRLRKWQAVMLSICPQRRGKAGEYRALPNSVSHKFMASNYSVSAICGCQTFIPNFLFDFNGYFWPRTQWKTSFLAFFWAGTFISVYCSCFDFWLMIIAAAIMSLWPRT